jgi:hypothetical protein
MTSEEFIAESVQNKTGKNAGLRSIWFNGKKKNKTTGGYDEHIYPRFQQYVATDFTRILGEPPSNRSIDAAPGKGDISSALSRSPSTGR